MTAIYYTNQFVTQSTLEELDNALVTVKTVNRDYQKNFNNLSGPTLNIRKPTYLVGQQTRTISSFPDIQQRIIPLTVNKNPVVPVQLTSVDRTLNLNDFRSNVTTPAGTWHANNVDSDLLQQMALLANNWVGSTSTAVNSFTTVNKANSVLDLFGVNPMPERYLCLSVWDYDALTSSVNTANSFNAALNKSVSDDAKITAGMRHYANFDVYKAQTIYVHTVGAYAGTPLVNGADQTGANLVTDGWTGSITGLLKKGDRFQIAGVYSVNPRTYQSTGRLAQFVVTADVNSSSGAATIPISPTIVTSGPYQNVTASPADNAALTILGAASSQYTVNLAYQRSAVTLAPVPFVKEGTFPVEEVVNNEKAKLALRMVGSGNVSNGISQYAIEMLYGLQPFYEYMVAVISPVTSL